MSEASACVGPSGLAVMKLQRSLCGGKVGALQFVTSSMGDITLVVVRRFRLLVIVL